MCAQCECCPYLGVAPIDRLTPLTATHPEELLGGAGVQSAVGDVGLLGQVLRALDGGNHPLHGEEGGQVGRVGRDDDEGEEPPHPSHDPSRQGSIRGGEGRGGESRRQFGSGIRGQTGV